MSKGSITIKGAAMNKRELHGKEFDFSQLGGHHLWFQIRDTGGGFNDINTIII